MAATKHVIVIGAGPGGLSSAMLLAKAGLKVTVLERLDRVGGRSSMLAGNGFKFDLGPTFFLYPQVLESIFQACGYNLRQEVPMVRLNPQYRVMFEEGGQIDATADLRAMKQQVAKLCPADAENIGAFMADNREKLKAFAPCLQHPFMKWSDLLNRHMLKLLPMLKPFQNIDKHLQQYFSDPRVRLAFCFQSKYLGMSPFKCPSMFSILSFLEYEYGVFHPLGGCTALNTEMARLVKELGGEIRLAEPVEKIIFEGRRAVGVVTRQGELRADAVVVNADFAHAMSKLVPNNLRRKWTDAKLEKKKYSCSTFMLYLGIDGLEEDLPHHTICLSKDYRQNLRDIEDDHVLSDNPSFYVQNACVSDPRLAPRGCSTLYYLTPVSHKHENIDWTQMRAEYRTIALQKMAGTLGIKDLEKRIQFETVVTPLDWEHGYSVFRGATFNLAHTLTQMLNFRPHNRFEDLDGMYLVGGGTHPGSGLPVIYEGARISARLLLQDLGLDAGFIDGAAPKLAALETPAVATV
jgi:phytoene desaturase